MPSHNNDVIRVQNPIGVTWLLLNWQLVAVSFAVALVPALWFVMRWRRHSQRAQALFDFTLAESLRKQGDAKGAIKQYDKILSGSCPPQLLWRCHSARSEALATRGELSLALVAANQAIVLAQAEIESQESLLRARDAAEAKKIAATATSKSGAAAKAALSASSTSSSSSYSPDEDPFLSLPPVSMSALLYQRGLIHEALGSATKAMEDFRQAVALDKDADLAFVTGHVARAELKARIDTGKIKSSEGQASSSSSSKKSGSSSIDKQLEPSSPKARSHSPKNATTATATAAGKAQKKSDVKPKIPTQG